MAIACVHSHRPQPWVAAKPEPIMTSNCTECGAEFSGELDRCPVCTVGVAKTPATEDMAWDNLLKPGQTASYGARSKAAGPHKRVASPAMLHSISGVRLRNYQVGDELGQYRLVRLLGQGGMGTVFEAEHKLLKRRVAIKILLSEFADQFGVVHRFFKEAQAVNRIGHPNLIDIMDCVESVDHLPYLVMELLEGESLQSVIVRRAPMRPEEVVSISRQIADALAAVHAKGIVHRDLKPDNIFISPRSDGTFGVRLLDFGIAKFMAADDSLLRTMTGEPIGTPEYMAPEQIEGVGMDHRLDIYAMGVMMYEMLVGSPVFVAPQVGQLLFHHLNTEPEPLNTRRQKIGADPVPDGLQDAILSCLRKDPDQRVQTMSQLAELLEWSIEEETGVVVLPDLEAVEAKVRERRKRWLWPSVGMGAACLILAVGGWWLLQPGGAGVSKADPKEATVSLVKEAGQTNPRAVLRRARRPGVRRVVISSNPSGAIIYRVSDGRYVGKTPHTLEIHSGQRWRLRLFAADYLPGELLVSGDGSGPVHVDLAPKKPPPLDGGAGMSVTKRTKHGRRKPNRKRRYRAGRPSRARERSRPKEPRGDRRQAMGLGEADTVNPFN